MKLSKVIAVAAVAIVGGASAASAVAVVGETEQGTKLAPSVEIVDFMWRLYPSEDEE